MHKKNSLLVLVVDDQEVNRRLLEVKLQQEGHRVILACDGNEAVEITRKTTPDMILMDVMMPGIDGFEAAQIIRDEEEEYRIPIIFLSAMSDKEHIIKGLSIGDDYITKPIALDLMEAKIASLSRLVTAQKQMIEEKRKSEDMFRILDEENKVAVHVMDRLIQNAEPMDDNRVKHIVIPESDFSGDIIFSRNTPTGKTHFLLADAVGHGLPAAINILPAFYAFDGMSKKGFPISMIARELNMRIKELLPIDRFVCAALIAVDFESGTVEIWNAGCPTVFWVDSTGNVVETFKAAQLPLGLNPNTPETFDTFLFNVSPGDQIIAFSDGISEIIDPKRTCEESLPELIKDTENSDRFDKILDTALENGQKDDISLLTLTFPDEFTRTSAPEDDSFRATPSKIILTFGPEMLVRDHAGDDVVSAFLASGIARDCPCFSFVLKELFHNALEHGILKMRTSDYADRTEYEAEKRRRIENLFSGFIDVEVMRIRKNGEKRIQLVVRDSGPGFDINTADGSKSGLAAIKQVADLRFGSRGNEAVAEIRCAVIQDILAEKH